MRAGRFRGAHTLRSRGFHIDFAFPGTALIHAAFRATFQERPRFCRSCIKLGMLGWWICRNRLKCDNEGASAPQKCVALYPSEATKQSRASESRLMRIHYRPPNVLAHRGELSAKEARPGGAMGLP